MYDWAAVQSYANEGHGFVECRRKFGFSHTAWIKAIGRGALRTSPAAFPDRRRRYDWAAVQAYYNEGHTYRQCREKFGFSAGSWQKAVKRGELQPRAPGKPIAELLRAGKGRYNIKARLLRAGILRNQCRECGLTEWLGRPLQMHIDHINGVGADYRLENLRMLCPNCHSQTDTYGGKNAKRRRRLHEVTSIV
jgi:hypothetical protein